MNKIVIALFVLNSVSALSFLGYPQPQSSRIQAQPHLCVGEISSVGFKADNCPANSVCNYGTCVKTKIEVNQACNDDSGCYCGEAALLNSESTEKTPLQICEKREKCLKVKDGPELFCGDVEVQNKENCKSNGVCHAVTKDPLGQRFIGQCSLGLMATIFPEQILCSKTSLMKPGQSCGREECVCSYKFMFSNFYSFIEMDPNDYCFIGNQKLLSARIKIFPREECRMLKNGNNQPSRYSNSNCWCSGKDPLEGALCFNDQLCYLDFAEKPRCASVKETKTIKPGETCPKDQSSCICETKPNSSQLAIAKAEQICMELNGKAVTYDTKITKDKVCNSNDFCACQIDNNDLTVCQKGERCVLNEAKSECQKVKVIYNEYCAEEDCFCKLDYHLGNICKNGQFCSYEGTCIAADAIVKPGQLSKKAKDWCVGTPVAGKPLEPYSEECIEAGMLCVQKKSTGRAYCEKAMKAGDPLKNTADRLCYTGDPANDPNFIYCVEYDACTQVDSMPACIRTRIFPMEKCLFRQGCACTFPSWNYKGHPRAICPLNSYCVIDQVSENPACSSAPVEAGVVCNSDLGCHFFKQIKEKPQDKAIQVKIFRLTKGQQYYVSTNPKFEGIVSILASTETKKLENTFGGALFNLGPNKPLYFAKCGFSQTIEMMAGKSQHICRNPENMRTKINNDETCYNLENGCFCFLNSDKIVVAPGESCKKIDGVLKKTKSDKLYVECPAGLACACNSFQNLPKLTATKYCKIDGQTSAQNQLLNALPNNNSETQKLVLTYAELLTKQIECMERGDCRFGNVRRLSLAGGDGPEVDARVKI